jgi:hypothetical protein
MFLKQYIHFRIIAIFVLICGCMHLNRNKDIVKQDIYTYALQQHEKSEGVMLVELDDSLTPACLSKINARFLSKVVDSIKVGEKYRLCKIWKIVKKNEFYLITITDYEFSKAGGFYNFEMAGAMEYYFSRTPRGTYKLKEIKTSGV